MSYNIDTWKLKRLENLFVPVAALYKYERTDWHPERSLDPDTMITTFEIMDTVTIAGKVSEAGDGEALEVTDIECYGEGSGSAMNYILEPAFKESKGGLEASCVWEGGDSINKIEVNDGVVTWTDIDI